MMKYGPQSCHKIGELSEIASARRAGSDLSRKLGFNEVKSGQLALLITEAGTNIGKHAESGHIYIRSITHLNACGVEVIAVDSGPGMEDPAKNFEDGNSTSGTYGVGLGAIKRLAHEVDIYSERGKGTVLVMIIWNTAELTPVVDWLVGSMCIPLASEEVCGDSWGITSLDSDVHLLVADGLGHGPEAATASLLAVQTLLDNSGKNPSRILQECHSKMKGTRGAAVAISNINTESNLLNFIGIGNIAGSIYSKTKRQHLLSHNGIVGSNMHKTKEFVHEWSNDSILIMHSDGIGTKWDLDHYDALSECHPSVIAAVLHRDYTRVRDDSTIVVLKRA